MKIQNSSTCYPEDDLRAGGRKNLKLRNYMRRNGNRYEKNVYFLGDPRALHNSSVETVGYHYFDENDKK